MEAYITDIAAYLPNQPVSNEEMERVLGLVNDLPSRTKKIILRNNGIKQRYYAIDPATGRTTHTNARLAAEAVKRLNPYEGFKVSDIELLSCGTSAPDQFMPGHASMVHGEVGGAACEAVSTAGICLAGISCLKYACMSVALGLTANGVATGSEQSSSFMRSRMCGTIDPRRVEQLEKQPALAFEADFLRWMLSDGAGAVFIAPKPAAGRLNLKVDWIEIISHADEMETCMYAGAVKNNDGTITGWREFASLRESVEANSLLVKQDAKLLNSEIIPVVVSRSLPRYIEKYGLKAEGIDWFLPHYSSDYFRHIIYDHLKEIDFEIPEERWFSNLAEKGNTGSASIYIILEEIYRSGKLRKGDRLLCFIPESGRFSVGYMMLTVV
ncbi:MAG: beta-ketoacyl-ACP synthase III [Desulfurivibrionaceae bacterium]|nr:beta-ketoacyl-ACP synthase III [Desulfobulbales bacterium]MDT8334624.1 beta-ketoacyl-ACP synthase III [Desulfurivibrionaceae bacterium]